MRVVLFSSAYAPHVGGVEELTRRLADQLRLAGDEVEVWTIRHPPTLPEDETIDGIHVRRFLLPLPAMRPAALLRFGRAARAADRALQTAVDDFDPDVLHVQCFSANGAYASRLGRPVVVTLQGETFMDDSDLFNRSIAMRRALRRALRSAAAVTACSAYTLEDAQRFGLPPGRGEVVPNGVQPNETCDEPTVPVPSSPFVLAYGRLVRRKGFDLLLDAFATVARDHTDISLVVGGAGPELEALRLQARRLHLDERVVFPGLLSRADVARLTDAAGVFALPSRVEAFGIVVLEAMRAGCPVVVSSRGGAVDIVRDGVDGLVADPHETAAFAAALHRVLSDDGMRARLAEAGRARAARFTWNEIAPRYRDIYERARA